MKRTNAAYNRVVLDRGKKGAPSAEARRGRSICAAVTFEEIGPEMQCARKDVAVELTSS
jgi:hypothetical protein